MSHIATKMDSTATAVGTFTGTALTVLVNISSGEVVKTIVLAALGAVASFLATLALKATIKWVKSWF